MPRPPGRPRKSTHDVDLARDCWEFIFRRFLECADPDVAFGGALPNQNPLYRNPHQRLDIMGVFDPDERAALLREFRRR